MEHGTSHFEYRQTPLEEMGEAHFPRFGLKQIMDLTIFYKFMKFYSISCTCSLKVLIVI